MVLLLRQEWDLEHGRDASLDSFRHLHERRGTLKAARPIATAASCSRVHVALAILAYADQHQRQVSHLAHERNVPCKAVALHGWHRGQLQWLNSGNVHHTDRIDALQQELHSRCISQSGDRPCRTALECDRERVNQILRSGGDLDHLHLTFARDFHLSKRHTVDADGALVEPWVAACHQLGH